MTRFRHKFNAKRAFQGVNFAELSRRWSRSRKRNKLFSTRNKMMNIRGACIPKRLFHFAAVEKIVGSALLKLFRGLKQEPASQRLAVLHVSWVQIRKRNAEEILGDASKNSLIRRATSLKKIRHDANANTFRVCEVSLSRSRTATLRTQLSRIINEQRFSVV